MRPHIRKINRIDIFLVFLRLPGVGCRRFLETAMALLRPVCIAAVLMLAAPVAHAQSTAAAQAAAPATSDADTRYQPSAPLNTMPRWSEFPAPPEGVPTPQEIKLRVNAQLARRQQLDSEVAALVWDKQEPDVIAAQAKALIDPAYLTPVDPIMTREQAEAYAASLRAKAAPPPIAQ
jgi:hypothetical protein